MRLRLQENPKEWRKHALLTAIGVAVITSLLCWRRIVSPHVWFAVLGLAGLTVVCAVLVPRWFRGYYRVSHRAGFFLATAVGYVVLGAIFVFIITPMGLVLRALGQDSLRLRRKGEETTYWQAAPKNGPLDRIF